MPRSGRCIDERDEGNDTRAAEATTMEITQFELEASPDGRFVIFTAGQTNEEPISLSIPVRLYWSDGGWFARHFGGLCSVE